MALQSPRLYVGTDVERVAFHFTPDKTEAAIPRAQTDFLFEPGGADYPGVNSYDTGGDGL